MTVTPTALLLMIGRQRIGNGKDVKNQGRSLISGTITPFVPNGLT
jgi:hypothetical protein